MTQEEKARAYDEALNKAKIEINTKGIGEAVNLCYQLFPQLAKSEDENLKNKSGYYKDGKFWKASTLWNATRNKIPQRVSNRYILQECTWNIGTLQRFADEVKNVQEVSLDYPIILDMNGNIIDGAHRVVKAYLEGKDIDIVYIGDDEWPEPDYDEEKAVKESEDERIRKWLYDLVDEGAYLCERPFATESILAYLEKQKETSHISEMCKENANSFADGIIEVRSFQRGMEEGRKLEKQKEQKPVECIEFDNEFEKQVSHLLASVLNGEWEYNEDFVKYAAQSLLGFAKNEMKPDEWDKREKLFRKALQAANARIGQLFEENQKLKEQKLEKYAQRLQKEQKQAQTSEEKEYIRTIKSIISDFIRDKKPENLAYYQRIYDWLDGRHVPFSCGHENGEPADPVFSKQEYESHPIISTDITSVKPVERSLEDDHIVGFVYDLLNEIEWKDDWAMSKEECLRLLSNYSPQKPVEWGKEDEEMRDTCIDLLKHFPRPCGEVIGPWKDCTAWLKSLPEKFNLQSKQECGKVTINGEPVSAENYSVDIPLAEWSEEDEEIYTFVCNFFETCWWSKTWDISREQVLQMLKSLRPQQKQKNVNDMITPNKKFFQWIYNRLVYVHKENPNVDYMIYFKKRIDELAFDEPSWKPSEEQMEALKNSAYGAYQNGDGPALRELYEQLEKL